jgi:DHA1 family tetracycline resistance protein-like MFS transporter
LETGLSLAAYGLGAIFAQAWGIRIYLRLLGERGTILFGIAFSLVVFLVLVLLPPTPWGGWLAILLCPVFALGEVSLPPLQARISRLADAQGEALGVVASMRSAAQIVGPLLMAGLFAWGASVPGGRLLGAPYLAGAVLMAGCFLLFHRSRAPEPAL